MRKKQRKMQKFILNPRDIFQYVCVEAPAGRFCVGGRLRPISPAQNFRNKTDFTPSFCVFREQRVKKYEDFRPAPSSRRHTSRSWLQGRRDGQRLLKFKIMFYLKIVLNK